MYLSESVCLNDYVHEKNLLTSRILVTNRTISLSVKLTSNYYAKYNY